MCIYVYSRSTNTKIIHPDNLLCKTVLSCSCWDTCSCLLCQMIGRTAECIIIVTSLLSYPVYTNDEEAFRKTNSDTDDWCFTLRCSHLKATKPWDSFLCVWTFFFLFSCALSFQCHWLLYARYKKQCMANEAHNGQIWLTCQCRGVKKRREGGRREEIERLKERKEEKKEGKRDR